MWKILLLLKSLSLDGIKWLLTEDEISGKYCVTTLPSNLSFMKLADTSENNLSHKYKYSTLFFKVKNKM